MTASLFHILNGGSTAESFKKTGIPGEHFAWREVLSEGPTPHAPDQNIGRHLFPPSVLKMRADYLQQTAGVPVTAYLKDMEEQQAKLGEHLQAQEVILWFEADLFCQINLVGLLSWFAAQPRTPAVLSLVYAEEFPGKPGFRGLGELNAAELETLFPKRAAVDTNLLLHAQRFWSAYCSPDPSHIRNLRKEELPAWMLQASDLHLRKFPSFETGLNAVEERTLRLLTEGPLKIADLFRRIGESPTTRAYGLGDLQFWGCLEGMRQLRQPPICIDGPPALPKFTDVASRSFLAQWTAQITDFGRQVLSGAKDTVRENGIDAWLGGVHLSGNHAVWRWNETTQELVKK